MESSSQPYEILPQEQQTNATFSVISSARTRCVIKLLLLTTLSSFLMLLMCNASVQSSKLDMDWSDMDSLGKIIEVTIKPEMIVQGIQKENGMRSFYSIPYGQANRWEKPQPRMWKGVWNGTKSTTSCWRPWKNTDDFFVPGLPPTEMTEDCLRLDIHTPLPLPEWLPQSPTQTWPVVVWLHGGEDKIDSASALTASAVHHLVVVHRIVVVAVDFRLGMFGFLGSKRLWQNSTGNWGTLDQKFAVAWVSEHIKHFGGDPSRITLGGWSSGAAAVSIHLTTSDRLFQRAILMSGGFASWAVFSLAEAEESYDGLLERSGCQFSADCQTPGPPCACLLSLPAAELLYIQNHMSGVSWAPIVDGATVFMHPSKALSSHAQGVGAQAAQQPVADSWDATQIPIIIGSASEDSVLDVANATSDDFFTFLARVVPKSYIQQAYDLYMGIVNDNSTTWTDPFHFDFSPAYWAIRRAMSDRGMTCVARRAARNFAGHAWQYMWDVRADKEPGLPNAYAQWPIPSYSNGPGIAHGSDQPFLFETVKPIGRMSIANDLQEELSHFIHKGRPSSKWIVANDTGRGFVFKPKGPVLSSIRKQECDFWDSLRQYIHEKKARYRNYHNYYYYRQYPDYYYYHHFQASDFLLSGP